MDIGSLLRLLDGSTPSHLAVNRASLTELPTEFNVLPKLAIERVRSSIVRAPLYSLSNKSERLLRGRLSFAPLGLAKLASFE
jgi:hypothetical protein